MEEISGPVIGIALVLSAVFVPTAFIPGITGRLYQQFAVTIAISVLLSAFNALTLSPALSALLLRPRREEQEAAAQVFRLVSTASSGGQPTATYDCRRAIRKSAIAFVLLVGVAESLAGFFGSQATLELPSRRRPGLRVHEPATSQRLSLQHGRRPPRTRSRRYWPRRPASRSTTSVIGFSLLSLTRYQLQRVLLRHPERMEDRQKREEQYQFIRSSVNRKLSRLPQGVAFCFSPPAIPGVGTSGGFTFVLEDRAGKDIGVSCRQSQQVPCRSPQTSGARRA